MKWWQIGKRDADLERELQSDLQLEEEEQREHGIAPEEARYAALRGVLSAPPDGSEEREARWRRWKNLLRDCGWLRACASVRADATATVAGPGFLRRVSRSWESGLPSAAPVTAAGGNLRLDPSWGKGE